MQLLLHTRAAADVFVELRVCRFHVRRDPERADAEAQGTHDDPAEEAQIQHELFPLVAVHQPAVDPDDSDQPADKAEDEAADNLEDSVSPDDFDVFDVLGLGKEQASDAGNAGTGTASADTDSTDTASADTDDSADAR